MTASPLSPDLVGQIFQTITPPSKATAEPEKQIKCFCCLGTGLIEANALIRYLTVNGIQVDENQVRTSIALRCRNPGCDARDPCFPACHGQIGFIDICPDMDGQMQICKGIHDQKLADMAYWASPEGKKHCSELRAFYRRGLDKSTETPKTTRKPERAVVLPIEKPTLTEQEAMAW